MGQSALFWVIGFSFSLSFSLFFLGFMVCLVGEKKRENEFNFYYMGPGNLKTSIY